MWRHPAFEPIAGFVRADVQILDGELIVVLKPAVRGRRRYGCDHDLIVDLKALSLAAFVLTSAFVLVPLGISFRALQLRGINRRLRVAASQAGDLIAQRLVLLTQLIADLQQQHYRRGDLLRRKVVDLRKLARTARSHASQSHTVGKVCPAPEHPFWHFRAMG